MEQDVFRYYQKKGKNCRFLTYGETLCIRQIIEAKYRNPDRKYGFSLFDILKMEEGVGAACFDAWQWIYPFIKDKRIVVFFDYVSGSYLELSDGSLFAAFYEDQPKDEFYIMDDSGTFLLGYNHSNCLFALGTAADWLERNENYLKFYKKI